jgi:hypothetical protein
VTGLPWVRLDADFYMHPKILRLLQIRDGARSAFVYVSSIAYAGRFGTDGLIEKHVLPIIHGRPRDAENLLSVGLWDQWIDGSWMVHDFADYQQTAMVSDDIRANRRRASRKGHCVRYHAAGCSCWQKEDH